jgi:ATP/ADP translocase
MQKILGAIILIAIVIWGVGPSMYKVIQFQGWATTLRELGSIFLFISLTFLGLYLLFN